MANPWFEVVYTVITGGGRSAYVSGSGIRVVQASSAADAASIVEQQVQGAKVGAVNGPYATQAEAEQQEQRDTQAQQAGTETTSGGTGTSNNPKLNVNLPNPLKAIGDFLGDLTSRNLWTRVLKIAVGFGLIMAGIVHLTGAQKLIEDAAGTAAKAAKAGVVA